MAWVLCNIYMDSNTFFYLLGQAAYQDISEWLLCLYDNTLGTSYACNPVQSRLLVCCPVQIPHFRKQTTSLVASSLAHPFPFIISFSFHFVLFSLWMRTIHHLLSLGYFAPELVRSRPIFSFFLGCNCNPDIAWQEF